MGSDMSSSGDQEALATAAFESHFGFQPEALGIAPGRVELLGNHTDYNGGLVLAVAIDRFTAVAGKTMTRRTCRAQAVNFNSNVSFDLDKITHSQQGTWPNYVKGVVWAMQEASGAALSSGFDVAIVGSVPLGAGLSSSASLQAALAFFLLQAGVVPGRPIGDYRGDADLPRMRLAQVLRRSENDFVGVASGLLDQFSSIFGRAHHALYLDCQTLELARLPLGQPGPAIVVCDSKTSRSLADGAYNCRRAECETIVQYFQRKRGVDAVKSLRDVSLDELMDDWDQLDRVGRKRARHVLGENERVRQGAAALRSSDLVEFGRLVSASHASSRDDFENSSEALDTLVEAAEASPGFLGGKLSGAGWAGCTVNLVSSDQAELFAESVRSVAARKLGIAPEVHICHAAEGARSREVG
jgi:galactokinase